MEQKKVLFADDDADFRDFMRDAIIEVSDAIGVKISITEAKDGKEAISMFDEAYKQNSSFDFVVTDYKMPLATGVDVIRHIVNTTPVPIIVISGH
ncbi:MAG: response regulator, partial [Patescibacteria group bacterium]|nr:response regulator [Patescibacteria group bacterium]